MKTAARLIFTIAALTVLLAIAAYPKWVKDGFNLAANWQLFAIQIFGLATIRVFWSWPLCDKILNYIVDALRGQGGQVRDIVPPPKPAERELEPLPPLGPYENPHFVTREQVGLAHHTATHNLLGEISPHHREIADHHAAFLRRSMGGMS